jgi:hypothetical protein
VPLWASRVVSKATVSYGFDSHHRGKMAYKDISDPRNKAAKLKHYEANKEQYLERNRKAKQKLRDIILDFKNGPCTDCGIVYVDEPWLMEIDHREPDEKMHNFPNLVNNGSESKLLAELAKCDPVCVVCHRRRTAKHFGWKANRFLN